MTDFAREVDGTVLGALNPGEQVIWTGHCLSRLGKQKKAGAAIGTPAGVLAFSLAAILGYSIWLITRVPLVGLIVAIATVVLVLYLTRQSLGKRVKDSAIYCRKQTVYVLTNQRAFVLKYCRTDAPMRSVAWRYVDEVRAESVGMDGRGTVRFWHWDPVAQRWDAVLQFYRIGAAYRVAERAQVALAKANE